MDKGKFTLRHLPFRCLFLGEIKVTIVNKNFYTWRTKPIVQRNFWLTFESLYDASTKASLR